jgi:hypothetical protein
MASTYLGEDFVLPAGRQAEQIKRQLAESGPYDHLGLRNDIARLDGHGVVELSELAIKAKSGNVMRAFVANLPEMHTLNYDQTITFLTHIKQLEEKKALQPEEVVQAAAALIRGYPTRQGMNLLISMADLFKDNSQFMSAKGIDDALVAHLEKTRVRTLSWSDMLFICDGLPKTSLLGALRTLTQILKDNQQYNEIKKVFEEFYDNNRLQAEHLTVFKEVLGEDQALGLCQDRMMQGGGFYSIHRAQEVFGEQALLSDGFVEKIKAGLNKPIERAIAPEYWKQLNKFDELDLVECWPETAKLMIAHYNSIPIGFKPKPSRGIVEFAVKHDLHITLLQKSIDALRATLSNKATSSFAYELASMSYAEVLSHGSNYHDPKLKHTVSYRQCLELCHEIGLIEAKALIAGIHPQVIRDLAEAHGDFKNPFEIMKHYPQAKGLFLENAMGL